MVIDLSPMRGMSLDLPGRTKRILLQS